MVSIVHRPTPDLVVIVDPRIYDGKNANGLFFVYASRLEDTQWFQLHRLGYGHQPQMPLLLDEPPQPQPVRRPWEKVK